MCCMIKKLGNLACGVFLGFFYCLFLLTKSRMSIDTIWIRNGGIDFTN